MSFIYTEHENAITFKNVKEVHEHIDIKYGIKNVDLRKENDIIKVVCNSSIVGIIKKGGG